jgi:hypothetical protein
VLTFVFFTVLATLGSGEHYVIDLVVAFPFCLMVQGLFAFSLAWGNTQRLASILLGLSTVLIWLSILRFANPLFWTSPVVSWILVVGTIIGSVLQQRSLADAVARAEAIEASPNPHVAAPVAELVES